MVREKIGRCTVMHESQHIDRVDTHVLTDGMLPFLKERDDHQSHIGGLSEEGESYCGKA